MNIFDPLLAPFILLMVVVSQPIVYIPLGAFGAYWLAKNWRKL
jgi:hypothetical protein